MRVGTFIVMLSLSIAAANARGEEAEYQSLREKMQSQLDEIAATCDQLDLTAEANITRDWLITAPADRHAFAIISSGDGIPLNSLSNNSKHWRSRFLTVRKAYAAELFALAQRSAAADDGDLAWRLLFQTLRNDPHHAKASAVLAAENTREAYAAKLRKGSYKHPLFGWAAGDYYRIETPHFTVTSSASAEETRELIRRLEIVQQVWGQFYFDYWGSATALSTSLRTGRPLKYSDKRRRVYLFANRDEYARLLKDKIPGVEKSSGIYVDKRNESFFFAGEEGVMPIWSHETAHQLFQETAFRTTSPRGAGFWLVEAAALYFESLRIYDGYCTVGGFDSSRLQHARFRALNDRFVISMESLEAFKMSEFQQAEEVAKFYTQTAGVAHFLLDGPANHRPAFTEALKRLYAGRYQQGDIADLTKMAFIEIDTAYGRSLNVTDDQLSRDLAPADQVAELVLGHTTVSDQGVAKLANRPQLRWLDLAETKITDRGLQSLANCTGLRDLNLEGTAITGEGLAALSGLSKLEYLDLSNTKIGDDDLAQIGKLKSLQRLWLNGTNVSDAGLRHLTSLMQLETLQVERTSVSAEGIGALKRQLPGLK